MEDITAFFGSHFIPHQRDHNSMVVDWMENNDNDDMKEPDSISSIVNQKTANSVQIAKIGLANQHLLDGIDDDDGKVEQRHLPKPHFGADGPTTTTTTTLASDLSGARSSVQPESAGHHFSEEEHAFLDSFRSVEDDHNDGDDRHDTGGMVLDAILGSISASPLATTKSSSTNTINKSSISNPTASPHDSRMPDFEPSSHFDGPAISREKRSVRHSAVSFVSSPFKEPSPLQKRSSPRKSIKPRAFWIHQPFVLDSSPRSSSSRSRASSDQSRNHHFPLADAQPFSFSHLLLGSDGEDAPEQAGTNFGEGGTGDNEGDIADGDGSSSKDSSWTPPSNVDDDEDGDDDSSANKSTMSVPQYSSSVMSTLGKRQRLKPLAFWHNEKPEYSKTDKGFALKGAIRPKTPKAKRQKQISQNREALSTKSVHRIQCKVKTVTDEETDLDVFVDPHRSEPISLGEGVHFFEGLQHIEPDNGGLRWKLGLLTVDPGKFKREENTMVHCEIFYVIDGEAEIRINRTDLRVKGGTLFRVPALNSYMITNTSPTIPCRMAVFAVRQMPCLWQQKR